MDERLYTYEYRRPRFNNPTYNSNNVSNSISFFANQLYRYHPSEFHQRQPYHIEYDQRPAGVVNKSMDNYERRGQQQPESPRVQQKQMGNESGRAGSGSRLSRYGTGVLNEPLPQHYLPLNEKDIYKKQEKQYDIINLKDRENNNSIQMYPKLSKEDYQMRYAGEQKQQELHEFKEMPIAGKPAYSARRSSAYNSPVINPKSLKNADEVYM